MKLYVKALIFVLSTVLVGHEAVASDKVECRTKAWMYGKNLSLREISANLNGLPRATVVQLAWGEVLKKDQSQSLAMPILQFLAGSETHAETRGYFKSLSMLMTDGQMPKDNIAQWPKRVAAKPVKSTLQTLCEQYRLSL